MITEEIDDQKADSLARSILKKANGLPYETVLKALETAEEVVVTEQLMEEFSYLWKPNREP